MREGELPLASSSTFDFMTLSAPDSNIGVKSSLDSKWQGLKVWMIIFQLFYDMKFKTSKFKLLAF